MKISEPGVYDIPIEEYHGQPCDGPSVSASGLRTLLLDSPAHYWAESSLNPNAEKADTDALRIGKAAHSFVLGEPEFNRYFVVSPFDDFRTKEARAWRDDQTRVVLKAAELDTVRDMAKAMRSQPSVAGAFQGRGQMERSLIWQDDETGIWLKARPDWLPDDPTLYFAQEFKTAVSAEPGKASRQAFELGYDIQAAMVLDGIRAAMGVDPLGIAHVVQEKAKPYAACLLMFDRDQIEFGRKRYKAALTRFAECLAEHQAGSPEAVAWPGYAQEPLYFQTPIWVAKAIEADKETNVNERARHSSASYLAAY